MMSVLAVVRSNRRVAAMCLAILAAVLGGAGSAMLGVCGPFTDVTDAAFCPFVLEIFTLGITTGTSPTTYDPGSAVTRLQMAAFLSRSVDGVLQRGSRRALVKKFWTAQSALAVGLTTLADQPYAVACDGRDVWVAGNTGFVSRVRASDARVLETWTNATGPSDSVIVAMGRVFVGGGNSGNLYRLDPSKPAASVKIVATLPVQVGALAFDGSRLWSANGSGSVSIWTPSETIPWTATTVTTGFQGPLGILYDGGNIWVSDSVASTLLKLDGGGAILQTVTVGQRPYYPAFDGANIWAPLIDSNAVAVVRASTGAVLATLTGNGLNTPRAASFDGQRVLVTNESSSNVSLWQAAGLTALGSFPMPNPPDSVCSDGFNFWIGLTSASKLARF